MEQISVKDLPFKVVPAEFESRLKYSKGIFGGDKKKFAQSLLEGKVWSAEVLVTDYTHETFHYCDSYYDYPFCQMKSMDGESIIKEWAMVTREAYFGRLAEWIEDDEQNEEETKAIRSKRRLGILLRYYIGKDEYYLLVDKKCYSDFNLFMSDIRPALGNDGACLLELKSV